MHAFVPIGIEHDSQLSWQHRQELLRTMHYSYGNLSVG